MGEITIQEISTTDKQAMMRFASLERKLLGGYPLYVSNFDSDLIRNLSGESAFTHKMDISLFISSDGERDVARCAAFINPEYQEAKNEKVGSIGYFAAASGCESIVAAMLVRAEGWLKERGIKRVIAPYNGSALLGMGFLIAAFDEESVTTFGWNPPYYADYLTQVGYRPAYPLWVYAYDFSSVKYIAAKERLATKHDFQVRHINKKRWETDLEIFRQVINETFTQEWEWHLVTSDEFLEFFESMKPMVDPQQMVIAEVQGKAVGICIGIPDWNPFIRGLQGKLGIVHQIQFLFRGGHYKSAGILFIAVRSEHRGRGIGPLLELTVLQRYEELGLKKAFIYTINEDNLASRKIAEAIGGVPRLLYHAYDKII
jgi:GNAT superfamily N-acetyltransferase